MKRFLFLSLFVSLTAVLFFSGPAFGEATGKMSAAQYQAGGTVTIEGTIDPGQELYVTLAQKKTFAPKETSGSHEVKRLN
ncbi:MAG: sulfite exporter TauE/SafE family protein, partial [Desulfobacteraceae bacterium]